MLVQDFEGQGMQKKYFPAFNKKSIITVLGINKN
jgi:hypothetical protein